MKIKTTFTFATSQYENAKPEVEIEVPDAIAKDPIQLYWYLYDMFHDIGKKRPKDVSFKPPVKWEMLKAQKEGFDMDNSPYLDGDQDEGSKIENQTNYNKRK